MSNHASAMPPGSDADWGIDRITVTYPFDPSLSDATSPFWQTTSSQNLADSEQVAESLAGSFEIGAARISVRVYTARNRCRIEFNPARIMTPKSTYLLPPELLTPIVEKVIEGIANVVWPAFDAVTDDGEVIRSKHWQQEVLVRRLDLARNFEIDEPETVKRALEQKKSKYQKSRGTYQTSEGGWGIENRTSRSGKDMFYDKSADLARKDQADESEITYSDGVFRFETQLMPARLGDLGLKRLDGLSADSCWNALSIRWDATDWGSPIASGGDLFDLVAQLPYRQRERLVGFLMLNAHGADSGISPGQERKMRKVAKDLGLTVGLPLEASGSPDSYLNLSTGRLEKWSSTSNGLWVEALAGLGDDLDDEFYDEFDEVDLEIA